MKRDTFIKLGLYFILIVIFIVSKKIIFPFAYFFLEGNNEILYIVLAQIFCLFIPGLFYIYHVFSKQEKAKLSKMVTSVKGKFIPVTILLSIIFAFIIMLIRDSYEAIIVYMKDDVTHLRLPNVLNASKLLPYLLIFVIMPAFIEEIIFRGIVGTILRQSKLSFLFLISALTFAIAHDTPFGMFVGFIMSLLSMYLFITTDSLVPSIFLHAIYNGFMLIVDNFYIMPTYITELITMVESREQLLIAALILLWMAVLLLILLTFILHKALGSQPISRTDTIETKLISTRQMRLAGVIFVVFVVVALLILFVPF